MSLERVTLFSQAWAVMDVHQRQLFVAELSLRDITPLFLIDFESDQAPIFVTLDGSQFLVEEVGLVDPRLTGTVGGSVPAWVIALVVLGGAVVWWRT